MGSNTGVLAHMFDVRARESMGRQTCCAAQPGTSARVDMSRSLHTHTQTDDSS